MKSASEQSELLRAVCDYALCTLWLICISPILLIIALLIWLDSGRPVLFWQNRVGKHGRVFRMVKFRTMGVNEASFTITSANDTRLTHVGKWLRRYKLDELPQLLNVLRGDMALVGPRPEVPELWKKYPTVWRRAMFSVKPGITGLASLMMRDESELFRQDQGSIEGLYLREVVPAKLRFDSRYLLRRSLLYDFEIVICSLLYVIFPLASVRQFVCRVLLIQNEDTK